MELKRTMLFVFLRGLRLRICEDFVGERSIMGTHFRPFRPKLLGLIGCTLE